MDTFLLWCKANKIPEPVPEYRFAPPRKWRFDYAWIPEKIALEVEGGAWTQGRHFRGAGVLTDMEKYNTAASRGWRLLRTTPKALTTHDTYLYLIASLGME